MKGPTQLDNDVNSIAHSHAVHATGDASHMSLPLSAVPIRVRIENTRVVGGQVTRHQVPDGGDGSQLEGGGRVHAEGWGREELGLDEERTDWPGIRY